MRHLGYAALGLGAWAITLLLSIVLTGAGHGWVGPLRFSIALIIFYPLSFVAAFGYRAPPWLSIGALVLAALILNALLLENMFSSEANYFQRLWRTGLPFVLMWLAFWIGWQALTLMALWKRIQARAQPPD